MTTPMTKFNVVDKPIAKRVTFSDLAAGTLYRSNQTGNVFIKVGAVSALCLLIGPYNNAGRKVGNHYSPEGSFSDFTIATNVEVSFE